MEKVVPNPENCDSAPIIKKFETLDTTFTPLTHLPVKAEQNPDTDPFRCGHHTVISCVGGSKRKYSFFFRYLQSSICRLLSLRNASIDAVD